MIILDTHVLIDFFGGSSDAERIINEFEDGKIDMAISVITISEIFYIVSRKSEIDQAKTVIDSIKSWIPTFPVSSEIAEKAGELKFRYAGNAKKGLPMADAIIAATAWLHDADLLTSDEHFDKIKEIKVRKV